MPWITFTIAACLVVLGRVLFRGWFNHLSLYAAVWGVSLTALQMELIEYYPLTGETWLFVLAGGAAFLFGSLTPPAAWYSSRTFPPPAAVFPAGEVELATLRRMLWVLRSALSCGTKPMCAASSFTPSAAVKSAKALVFANRCSHRSSGLKPPVAAIVWMVE